MIARGLQGNEEGENRFGDSDILIRQIGEGRAFRGQNLGHRNSLENFNGASDDRQI
jgi:hypothetical protein